jgi:hypothetical protein
VVAAEEEAVVVVVVVGAGVVEVVLSVTRKRCWTRIGKPWP